MSAGDCLPFPTWLAANLDVVDTTEVGLEDPDIKLGCRSDPLA